MLTTLGCLGSLTRGIPRSINSSADHSCWLSPRFPQPKVPSAEGFLGSGLYRLRNSSGQGKPGIRGWWASKGGSWQVQTLWFENAADLLFCLYHAFAGSPSLSLPYSLWCSSTCILSCGLAPIFACLHLALAGGFSLDWTDPLQTCLCGASRHENAAVFPRLRFWRR